MMYQASQRDDVGDENVDFGGGVAGFAFALLAIAVDAVGGLHVVSAST